jgi:hypothetical protein
MRKRYVSFSAFLALSQIVPRAERSGFSRQASGGVSGSGQRGAAFAARRPRIPARQIEAG